MFRNPRENGAPVATQSPLLPSTGRSPTPPFAAGQEASKRRTSLQSPMASSTTPLVGRNKPTPKKTPSTGTTGKSRPNGNIMKFFKKAESTSRRSTDGEDQEDESLFIGDTPVKKEAGATMQTPTPPREYSSSETTAQDGQSAGVVSPLPRYNEDFGPVKRRRIDATPTPPPPVAHEPKAVIPRGPFLDDSDDDDKIGMSLSSKAHTRTSNQYTPRPLAVQTSPGDAQLLNEVLVGHPAPHLKNESTSMGEVTDFDGVEDFIDEEFPEEGEEYLERRWMEEQAQIEIAFEEDHDGEAQDPEGIKEEEEEMSTSILPQDAGSPSCPICGGSTAGMADQVGQVPFFQNLI